jgi:serine/threonine protein kinase
MKLYDKTEIWEFGDGDPKFLHTNVIFQDGDKYFWSQPPKRGYLLKDPTSIDRSLLQEIPPEHIWPLFEDKLTICQNPDSPDVYIKQPRLTGYNGSASLGEYLLQEAHTCQFLMKHPHENVARYLGCVVKADRITGLCFQKYEETLADRLEAGHLVDNESCHQQVKAGIDHLHELDLVHNDIHPDNVMFTGRHSNTPVIIDFDSCAFKGDPLPDKRGKMPKGACTAEFENDSFSLDMLWKELNLPEEA